MTIVFEIIMAFVFTRQWLCNGLGQPAASGNPVEAEVFLDQYETNIDAIDSSEIDLRDGDQHKSIE